MTTMAAHAAGSTEIALLEETIGHNFRRTASTYPDVEALVDVTSGRRWIYAELDSDYALSKIINGDFDAYIDSYAPASRSSVCRS